MEKIINDPKARLSKSRFSNKKLPCNLQLNKLVKIQHLISKYTNKLSPLISRRNQQLPIKVISSFSSRTKSCQNLNQKKLPCMQLSNNKSRSNMRYLSKDFEEEESKNFISTPDESWNSTKKLHIIEKPLNSISKHVPKRSLDTISFTTRTNSRRSRPNSLNFHKLNCK